MPDYIVAVLAAGMADSAEKAVGVHLLTPGSICRHLVGLTWEIENPHAAYAKSRNH
jgi:hypothetical protein